MKTKLSNLRFDSGSRMSGFSTKKKSDEDDDFDEDDESPWICCRCATDNDETSGMCYSCGHDKCTHCSEF